MDLAKKTVIITGASMGIGAGLAEALARRGANLVLAARSVDELAALAARCKAAGARAIAVPTDVADPNACERMVQAAAAEFGGVDVLVNNAGITMLGRFDEVTDLGLFERLMRVNYLGSVYCTHFALPLLKQSKGLLVAVTSLTGKTGVPTRTGYAASKHAMHGFFDSLRIELRGSGVDVLVVAPGFVATDIRSHARGTDGQVHAEGARGEGEDMSVEECVAIIVRAMERREREVVMTARARFGLWMKLLAPSLVDRIAANAIASRK